MDALLGDYAFEKETFPNIEKAVDSLNGLKGNALQRWDAVCRALLDLIDVAPYESFLLSSVIDFVDRVNKEKILDEPFNFSEFELWLNQFSGLATEENYVVRAKIAGKYLPRDEYQAYFPIGMGRTFPGSHFVTAHNPPDLDTTVASFWGWVDAFAARVSDGLHIWNLPGGEAPPTAKRLFHELFDEAIFCCLPRQNGTLTVSALDLVSQKNFERQYGSVLTSELDHGRFNKLIIKVDREGYYGGCWRSSDVERYRTVTLLINNVWAWLENELHVGLLSLFAKAKPTQKDLDQFVSSLLDQPIGECAPVANLSCEHLALFTDTLVRVFGVEKGLSATFSELTAVRALIDQMAWRDLFDASGALVEDRPKIFHHLERIISTLDQAIKSFYQYLDRLEQAIAIKHKVIGDDLHYVTPRAEIEEIRKSMGDYRHLTVCAPAMNGELLPLGVIHSADLQKPILGTVTLRDFCNREEVKIPSHLEVISVVDHHRASLHTTSFATAIMGDVQSCNVLLAEQAFLLNDRFGLGGLSAESLLIDPSSPARIVARLGQRMMAKETRGAAFVHPKREFAEYLSFLYAILDDTDLLDRVTSRDVIACASLINRLKSIVVGKEVESINLDDIPRNEQFAKAAATRILQNKDMYSLYSKIYSVRELEVDQDLKQCVAGGLSNVFADTKEQKGCARVGQTKIFPKNYDSFSAHAPTFRDVWLRKANEVQRHRPELELHVQMITTIPGAEEVYLNKDGQYAHTDEIWIWVPPTEEAHDRLASYLSAFGSAPEVTNNELQVELMGPEADRLRKVFTHHFRGVPVKVEEDKKSSQSMAVLRFKAASINSRKLSITPYIPSV